MSARTICRLLVTLGALVAASVHAQLDALDVATPYRLTADATWQEGCFDPCLCPIMQTQPVRGVLNLGPRTIGNVVDFREVSDLYWTVGLPGDALHTVTGAGSYRVTNFGPPQQHALDLTLSIDGGEPQHFFSDFAPLDDNAGAIDLTVSMNGQFCYDIVIRVSMAPVPRDQLRPFALVNGSAFQQGCFDPCDCLLEEPRPMRGRFDLVQLMDIGTYAEYGVLNARFYVSGADNGNGPVFFTGSGLYTLIQGFAGPLQSLDMALSNGAGGLTQFDSGLHNTDSIFPRIDVAIDMNDRVCFDQILTIRARPPRYRDPQPIVDPALPIQRHR